MEISKQETFSHAWSLCIEEQFYLILPFTLIALLHCKFFKKAYWVLIALFVTGFIVRTFIYINFVGDNDWVNWYKWIYYATWNRLDGLLVDVTIAALIQFRPVFSKKILAHQNLLLLTGLVILPIVCSDQIKFTASILGFPLTDIGYGFIVLSALSTNSFLYKYESKITAKIATLSYGIYLIHKLIIHVSLGQLIKLKIEDKGNLMFIICTGIVFITALLANEIIEKPFLKLRKRLLAV